MALVAFPDRTDPLTSRRWELYGLAAPLLEQHGFRGVSVGQLAYACGISPAGLYHYFPSKTALALFPLTPPARLCPAWQQEAAALPADPLVRIHALVEYLVRNARWLQLALRMTREISLDVRREPNVRRILGDAQREFPIWAREIEPTVDDGRAADLFRGLIAVLVADLPGFERTPEVLARQLTDVAAGWVTSLGIDRSTFDAALGRAGGDGDRGAAAKPAALRVVPPGKPDPA